MIPTTAPDVRCGGCEKGEAETIVDSMMNVGLLLWAKGETGDAAYSKTAARHARNVARLLVRSDGSTAQAVDVRRSDGSVRRIHTKQGLSDSSTWARGQGWAVYGFAQTGAELRDPDLLAVAERAAGYVDSHLPASGVPLYDYDAPADAPVDTSAGVITAAGLLRLADACAALPGACHDGARWRPLGTRMLHASLEFARRRPPLGFLGSQVYSLGGHARWDDRGEFLFGLAYALEAVSLVEGR
jgi:unsaturated chondroitin disaccharide hydrolase